MVSVMVTPSFFELFHQIDEVLHPVVDHKITGRGWKVFGGFNEGTPLGKSFFAAVCTLLPLKNSPVFIGVQAKVGFIPFPKFTRVLALKKYTSDPGYPF